MPQIKVCESYENPPRCSSCGQAKPTERHVDFGSAWDGPVINALDVVVSGATAVQLDDLKVCETCLRDATRVLDNFVAGPTALAIMERRVAELEALNAGQRRSLEAMEAYLATKAKPKPKAKAAA